MAKPETVFTNSVHAHLDRATLYWMKNHNEYVGGVFDCWYSGKGDSSTDLWIEYKFVVLPKRDATLVVPDLSAIQAEWGTDRANEGRNVAVIVGCKEGGVYLPPGYWAPLPASEFRRRILTRKALAALITEKVCSTLTKSSPLEAKAGSSSRSST